MEFIGLIVIVSTTRNITCVLLEFIVNSYGMAYLARFDLIVDSTWLNVLCWFCCNQSQVNFLTCDEYPCAHLHLKSVWILCIFYGIMVRTRSPHRHPYSDMNTCMINFQWTCTRDQCCAAAAAENPFDQHFWPPLYLTLHCKRNIFQSTLAKISPLNDCTKEPSGGGKEPKGSAALHMRELPCRLLLSFNMLLDV